MIKKVLLVSLFLINGLFCMAQQTVGLFENETAAFDGYTLFTPQTSTNTYLIDNCGNLVNTWVSQLNPGLAVYLLETGELLRTGMVSSITFNGGGIGGMIERYDWDGTLNWQYKYANSLYHQHHDIEPLPNGNFLLIAWEYKSASQAIAMGRDPSMLGISLWPDQIVEIEPVGSDQAIVVWEWHLWDHLIQDFDSLKPNFGVVAEHPERIDINYTSGLLGGGGPDWNHVNGIDYNESLDQIVMSSRLFSEIWIIDHSTTSTEAASHIGGTYGKGGDILYRYGNPRVYDRGMANDQVFNGQHNPTWIPEGHPNEGKIMVFNNFGGGPSSSSVDIIHPPTTAPGVYVDPGVDAFGPATYDWRYSAPGFYSQNISGATSQPNGNILICEGNAGTVFEVDSFGNTTWLYINPVGFSGPVSQGTPPLVNGLFRAEKYAPDFPGFIGKDLTPGDPIELNPLPSTCIIWNDSTINDTTTTGMQGFDDQQMKYSNPFSEELRIAAIPENFETITVCNIFGQVFYQCAVSAGALNIQSADWPVGYYFIRFHSNSIHRSSTLRLLKLNK